MDVVKPNPRQNRISGATPYLCLKSRFSTLIFHELIIACFVLIFGVWVIRDSLMTSANTATASYEMNKLVYSLELQGSQNYTIMQVSYKDHIARARNLSLSILESERIANVELLNSTILSVVEEAQLQADEVTYEVEALLIRLNSSIFSELEIQNQTIFDKVTEIESEGVFIDPVAGSANLSLNFFAINNIFESTIANANYTISSELALLKSSRPQYISTLVEIYTNHSSALEKFLSGSESVDSTLILASTLEYVDSSSIAKKVSTSLAKAQESLKRKSTVLYIILSILAFIVFLVLLIWNWVGFRYEVEESTKYLYVLDQENDSMVFPHHVTNPMAYYMSLIPIQTSKRIFRRDHTTSIQWFHSMLFAKHSKMYNLFKIAVFTAFGYVIFENMIRNEAVSSSAETGAFEYNSHHYLDATFSFENSAIVHLSESVSTALQPMVDELNKDVASYFENNFGSSLPYLQQSYTTANFDPVFEEIHSWANLIPRNDDIVAMSLISTVNIPSYGPLSTFASMLENYMKYIKICGYLSIIAISIWCCSCFICILVICLSRW